MTTPDIAQQIVDANRAGAKPGSPVIGLVLGSGAARGFAHIGVMRALDAHGIKPDIIVGTSMGALVGGCYATGQLDTLEAWARSLTVRRVFGYLDVKFGGSGLISGNRLARQLEEFGRHQEYRRPADPVRGYRHRGRHRSRGLADARLAGVDLARVLRTAGNFSPRASGRPLAGRRRTRQSGAGVGGARLRCAGRHRRQHGRRPVRPRHHYRESRLGSGRRAIFDAGCGAARRLQPMARHVRRRTRVQARDAQERDFGPRRQTGLFNGDDRILQHHAGPSHPHAARRRPAGRAYHAAHRPCRLARFSPRRGIDRGRTRGNRESNRVRSTSPLPI